MCTAISFRSRRHLFGRTFDLEHSYNESVVITPRGYDFCFRESPMPDMHYALIGIAHTENGYPLYYDAVNEKGLCAAALNFPENAYYRPYREGAVNLASYELLPWLLRHCIDLAQAHTALQSISLTQTAFSADLPCTPLHWMLADKTGALVIEPMKDGLCIHENHVGVLTNAPPFEHQLSNLCSYLGLSRKSPANSFGASAGLQPISRGTGAFGLPGDSSSPSRFVRSAFLLHNSPADLSPEEEICHFFHIMDSAAQVRGSVELENGALVSTLYTACCDAQKGIYYYTTYENRQLHAVHLHHAPLDQESITVFPLQQTQQIFFQN